MESVFQLVEAYKEFKLHCCVLCEKVAITVQLPPECDTNVTIELRYCNPHRVIKYKYDDIKEGLTSLANIFKDCLLEWVELVARVRMENTHLNFFSLQQIKFLQTTLAAIFASAKGIETLDAPTAHLLDFIFPDCDASAVNESVASVVTERATGSPGQANNESSIEKIQNALTNEGYDDKTISQTVQILFRNPDIASKDTDKLIKQAIELAGRVEKDFICQAEEQRKSNWKTADQDLNAAQLGNKPAHEAFKQLWKIYLHNINCSHSDFLSFHDVNLFLSFLAAQKNSRFSKEKINEHFTETFKQGKPVSFNLQTEKHLLAAVHLFKQAFNRLPQMEEVLCCSEHTVEEDLIVFLHRAILDKNPQSLYIIINADKLPSNLSVVAEEQFNRLMNSVSGRIQSHLFVIFGLKRQKQSPFSNCLSMCVQEFNSQSFDEQELKKFVEGFLADAAKKKENKFLWISSERSGMGKSMLCENISKARGCSEPIIFCCSGAHLSTNDLYNFFAANAAEGSSVVFHLDIAREVQIGFDSCITQLAIFGGIVNSKGDVWRRRPKDLYLLEHSEGTKVASRFQVLGLLPRVSCPTPAEFLSGETQRLENFISSELLFYKEKIQNYKAITITLRKEKVVTNADILHALIANCGVLNPSWLELINFAEFYQTQFNDMKKSIFCSDLLRDDLPGFRDFVSKLLLIMSRDFSTRSIDCSDQSDTSTRGEENFADFQLRRHWEQDPHPYLLFNEDGQSFTFFGFTIDESGNLVDSNTNAVLEKAMINRRLREGLARQEVPINEKFDDLSRSDKIARMRMVFGFHESKSFQDPDKSYELTMDNVKKILAIYMRFRSKIPVVLIGETGCGKTKLVEFLARIIQPNCEPNQGRPSNMRVLKVHGGVTLQDIEEAVTDAENLSKVNYKKPADQRSPYTILFFDEVNTTSFVGLIKEIMLDGRINGRKIKFKYGLRCVAACNPYRKHPKSTIKRLENSGLGYRVRKEDTQDRFGNIPMRHLVYRVKPLPLSLTSVLWDFGNLSENAEEKYIARMVYSRLEKAITDVEKEKLTTAISFAQRFMRKLTDETKYVSLREVEREIELFKWILNGTLIRKYLTCHQNEYSISRFDISAIISFAVCYLSRLPRDNKDNFLNSLIKVLSLTKRPIEINSMITEFQEVLIHDIELPSTLAKNDALRENIFMMAISVSLRIPLFLVGKPGSSKSISKAIVRNNMKGSNSVGKGFRMLPSTDMVSFQCSPWSTSEDISKVFSECAHKQKDNPQADFVPVVVLDEIGLAEDSPKMPLKVLHPLLEDGVPLTSEHGECHDTAQRTSLKVAFIGLSNWALDPAKMNRGLYLLRDVPTHEDLMETAKGICKERISPIEKYLKPLTNFYLKIFEDKNIEREFFGLRDFFSLLKHLLKKSEEKGLLTEVNVAQALLRNFSGLDKFNPVEFYSLKNGSIPVDIQDYFPLRDALQSTGLDQRYLLLITENYTGVKLLRQLLDDVELKIIFGSSFPKDQEYTTVCKTINKIKICMERGSTIVLMNLEALYESLYDVLNLCYEEFSGNRFVDLGLGTHRLKSRVHSKFRIIVVADDRTVNDKFPIPLISRLEKHKLTSQALMDKEKQKFCEKQRHWAKKFSQGEKLAGVFVGFHEDMIPSLSLEVNLSESCLRERMLSVSTPDSLLRLPDENERKKLLQSYYGDNGQGCLQSFLENYDFPTPLLQITTFDRLLSSEELNLLAEKVPKLGRIASKNLNVCETESQFIDILKKGRETNDTLILQYEGVGTGYQDLIYCAKYLIEEENRQDAENDAKTMQRQCGNRVILIIKLVRSLNNSFSGFDCGLWHCVHIEELLPPNRLNVPLLNDLESLQEIFLSDKKVTSPLDLAQPVNTKLLLKDTLFAALSLLYDRNRDETRPMYRRNCLLKALEDQDFLQKIEPFLRMALQKKETSLRNTFDNYEPKAWLRENAASSKNVLEAGTLIESIWRILKQKTAPAFACLLAFLDKDSNLENYSRSDTRDLWLKVLESAIDYDDATDQLMNEQFEVNRVEVFSSATDGHPFASKFPFSWAVLNHLESVQSATQTFGSNFWLKPEDSALKKILESEPFQQELIESFCHDLLHMKFPSITEGEAVVLQKLLISSINDKPHDTLLSAILASIEMAQEYKDQIIIFIRLTNKTGVLIDKLKITHLRELTEATFYAFIEIFEQKKRLLNTAIGRSEWIDLFDKSQAIITRLLHRHRNVEMAHRWDKVMCVVLFLRNVMAPFDKEKLHESTIKPIRLWNSLTQNPELCFQQSAGIRLTESFLEDANKDFTEKISGASTCSKCEERKDRLTLLPCNDRICKSCMPKQDGDLPSSCPKCKVEFDPSAIDSSRPETLDKFKARCNVFMLDIVSQLCLRSDVATGRNTEEFQVVPSEDLRKHLLTYVTRNSSEAAVFGFFADDKDPSPVFRSFILQQLLKFNYNEVVNLLSQHIKEAETAMGTESHQELWLIILNCLEDLAYIRSAKQDEEANLKSSLCKFTELPQVEEKLEIEVLHRVVDHRIFLSYLAAFIAKLPKDISIESKFSYLDLQSVSEILRTHDWSRVFFLRSLGMAGGTYAALERLQNDQYLSEVFAAELDPSRGQPPVPDLLQSHSDQYREMKRFLWRSYLSGDRNLKPPSSFESENSVAALVSVNWENIVKHLPTEVKQDRLKLCVESIGSVMNAQTQNLVTKLKALNLRVSECHQVQSLLIHFEFSLLTSKDKSDFTQFLSQLAKQRGEWYLPAMPHDELFAVFSAAGKNERLGAYACPNGHPYYIGNCTRPWYTSTCLDCGSTIGGTRHVSADGNMPFESVDRTRKDFIPIKADSRPEPVRQLSACSVALLRMLQSLALMKDNHQDCIEEFNTGVRLFASSTGRNEEDAYHTLHLVLAKQLCTNTEKTGFDLTKDDGRRKFENRMYESLLRPILDKLNDHLRDSNRLVSQDDPGTTSEIIKLIHETSDRDTEDPQAFLWRFRRIITVENATQAFQELGGTERGQYRLIDAIIKWEPVLRYVKELPVLVKTVNELVSAWKKNKELKTTTSQGISAISRIRCRNSNAAEIFIKLWNQLRGFLGSRVARFEDGETVPIEKHVIEAKRDFSLAAFLPHKKPWGRCIVGLVQLLVEAHNAVLDSSGIELDEVDLSSVDATSVIDYDPNENLLPMLLANCTYSLSKGEGCQVSYNFHGLQQQLLERVVRGRVRIVGFLPQMVYKEEFNLLEFFQQLEKVVPQAKDVRDTKTLGALNVKLATPVITALLDESLKVTVNFLISLRSRPEPQTLLHEFMTSSLKMESGLPTESLRRHVTVDQIRLLWLSLDHQLWQHLADDGFEPAKFDGSEPLSKELKDLLPKDLKDRRSLVMEKLHALIKLEMCSQPEVRDLPLKDLSACYRGYEVFDDWPAGLLGKHAGEIWMQLHQLALE